MEVRHADADLLLKVPEEHDHLVEDLVHVLLGALRKVFVGPRSLHFLNLR